MNSIDIIYSPQEAHWVGWAIFLIMAIGVLGKCFSPTWLIESGRAIFSQNERAYLENTQSLLRKLLQFIFRNSIISFVVYMFVYEQGPSYILSYLKIFLLVMVVSFIKKAITFCVCYVFELEKTYNNYYIHYKNLQTLCCTLLYLALLFIVNFDFPMVMYIYTLVVFVAYLICLVVRTYGIMTNGTPLSILYILLYIVCLEVIPILFILSISKELSITSIS